MIAMSTMVLARRRIYSTFPFNGIARIHHGTKFMCSKSRSSFSGTAPIHDANSHIPSFMRLQVVGNGALGISRSVLLKYRNTSILFNCGEGSDNSFKGHVNDVFVTHIDWMNFGGLLSLTYKAISSNRAGVFLHGPPGVDYFMGAAERFLHARHSKGFVINLPDKNLQVKTLDKQLTITPVPLRSNKSKVFTSLPVDKSFCESSFVLNKNLIGGLINRAPTGNIELGISYSYICEFDSRRAWCLSECVKRGIKPGVHMKQLWEGENVTLDDGTVVQPNDVIKAESCPSIIVVDCPTEGYLNDLLHKKEYEMYYKSENLLDIIIIHFTPMDVMHNKRYIAWMGRFPLSTKHLIVNDSNDWGSSGKSQNRQEVCRLISPQFFPSLRKPKETMMTMRLMLQDDGIKYGMDTEPTWYKEEPTEHWLQKWNDQLKEFQLIQSWSGTCVNLRSLKTERFFEPFIISSVPVNDFNNSAISITKKLERYSRYGPRNPRITFLGTCSQGNSVYRNTSGILLQMSEDKAMLLDCGDGTVKQLATLFDDDELLKVLTSLKCIFISHTHADHHAGVVGLLISIKKAWNLLGKQPKKVLLIVPPPLLDWFETYHNNIQPILDHVTLINVLNLAKSTKLRIPITLMLKKNCELKDIKVCWAIHCPYSYCVTFEHISGWKISYSGDTEFNENFATMGLNSDLLIHEATYGTGLDQKARDSRHSTTEHAIKIGDKMQAKYIILTHFSRRYSVIPCLKDLENTTNVSVAFDFLQFNLNDVYLLPKLNNTYAEVFEEYEQNNIENNVRLAEQFDDSSFDD